MRRASPHPQGQAAVADTVGSILMVGITVVMAVILAALILAFKGPVLTPRANVSATVNPGADAQWGTADDSIQVIHSGGEALKVGSTIITYSINGVSHTLSQSSVPPLVFTGNQLKIGDTWKLVTPLASTDTVKVNVITTGAQSTLLATASLVPGLIDTGSSCIFDTNPPVASWSQTPPNLDTSRGTSAVLLTLTEVDGCSGVNTNVNPHLWYRITPGPLPGPTAFTDLGAMAHGTGAVWTASIPAPPLPALGWVSAFGQGLEYYATGMTDLAPVPNVGQSLPTVSDVIDLVGSTTYVTSHVDTAGIFSGSFPFANLGADDGLEAMDAEACFTVSTTFLCGTSASVGTSPANALLSDNTYATIAGGTGVGAVEVTGFDIPAATTGATPITGITVNWEGLATGSGSNPVIQLQYKLGAAGAWTNVGATIATTTSDTTTSRSTAVGAPFPLTVAQGETLFVRPFITSGSKTLSTDALTVTPTYAPAATSYDLNLELDWTGLTVVPTPALAILQMEYHVAAGESYTVEKWGGAAWSACTGSLTSTVNVQYTCTLTTAELLGGAPRIRITGAADTAAATSLAMDYARIVLVS
jgi:hypothetical protein